MPDQTPRQDRRREGGIPPAFGPNAAEQQRQPPQGMQRGRGQARMSPHLDRVIEIANLVVGERRPMALPPGLRPAVRMDAAAKRLLLSRCCPTPCESSLVTAGSPTISAEYDSGSDSGADPTEDFERARIKSVADKLEFLDGLYRYWDEYKKRGFVIGADEHMAKIVAEAHKLAGTVSSGSEIPMPGGPDGLVAEWLARGRRKGLAPMAASTTITWFSGARVVTGTADPVPRVVRAVTHANGLHWFGRFEPRQNNTCFYNINCHDLQPIRIEVAGGRLWAGVAATVLHEILHENCAVTIQRAVQEFLSARRISHQFPNVSRARCDAWIPSVIDTCSNAMAGVRNYYSAKVHDYTEGKPRQIEERVLEVVNEAKRRKGSMSKGEIAALGTKTREFEYLLLASGIIEMARPLLTEIPIEVARQLTQAFGTVNATVTFI